MPDKPESCENCGRLIGKLETPWIHGDHVVCLECWERLQNQNRQSMQPVIQPPVAAQFQPALHMYPPPPPVQTIEQTGKTWKLQILLASFLSIFGFVVFIVAISLDEPGAMMGFGCLAFFAGILWFVMARVLAWWHHG